VFGHDVTYSPRYGWLLGLVLLLAQVSGPPQASASGHWAFQPLTEASPPEVADETWARTPIDRFILSTLEAKGIAPAPEANKRTLIRRAYFGLTGLPPSPEAVEAFLKDDKPDAYTRLIETLLASPRYGERWASHWLDVARYADSGGYEFDTERPTAYPYRDFVIRALNDDMPYDQFVKWQLAGDEYAPDSPLALAATGFCTSGPTISNQETEKNRYDEIDDMVSTTGSAFLAMTMTCARCHDHKYDPIPKRDYYRMSAAFTTSKRHDAFLATRAETADYLKKKAAWDGRLAAATRELEAFLAPMKWALREAKVEALDAPADEKVLLRSLARADEGERKKLQDNYAEQLKVDDASLRKLADEPQRIRWDELVTVLSAIKTEQPTSPPRGLALTDSSREPVESFELSRGDPERKRGAVQLGFLSALPGSNSPRFAPAVFRRDGGSNTTLQRTALAEWLTDADTGAGALTLRVIINRVWQIHFGAGLSRTPNNFGLQGEAPSHPELLDWLAAEFAQQGWSLKTLHRQIMLSAVYCQGGAFNASNAEKDPENRLLWRRTPNRLSAEAIRDAMLNVSGCMNHQMYGPGFHPFVQSEAIATATTDKWPRDIVDGPATWRRSVYIYLRRSSRVPMMETFDSPDMTASCGRRMTTTVPAQALTLMNSPFVLDQAKYFATRVLAIGGAPGAMVQNAYALALGREPRENELAQGVAFLERQTQRYAGSENPFETALADYCQALFSLNEFVYID
jgi:hypothetical protein